MPTKRTRAPKRAPRGTHPAKVTQTQSGGWRVQVWNPLAQDGKGGYVSACVVLGIPNRTWPSETEGVATANEAEAILNRRPDSNITLAQLRERWVARKKMGSGAPIKEASTRSNAERTQVFIDRFGNEALILSDRDPLRKRIRDFARKVPPSQREALKAMFNFAIAEDLLPASPLHGIVVGKGRGNEEVDPPKEAQMRPLLAVARSISPDFAAWLTFGAFVGTRPGETDGLQFSDFNGDYTRVRIVRQWHSQLGKIQTPKKLHPHEILVPPPARAAVLWMVPGRQHEDDYVFRSPRDRTHWTKNSRAYYWNAVMLACGFRRYDPTTRKTVSDFDTYLATRHHCGWYLRNVKMMEAEAVAYQLRHDDHGDLVRKRYGSLDRNMAIEAIAASFGEDVSTVRAKRLAASEAWERDEAAHWSRTMHLVQERKAA